MNRHPITPRITRPDTPRNRRGFSLLECTMAIALLIAFAALSSQVLMAVIHTTRRASEADVAGGRFDAALARLRADAWGASKLEAIDESTLRVTTPGSATVEWRSDNSGLHRTVSPGSADAASESWEMNGRRAAFSAAGHAVRLTVPPGRMSAAFDAALATQLSTGDPR